MKKTVLKVAGHRLTPLEEGILAYLVQHKTPKTLDSIIRHLKIRRQKTYVLVRKLISAGLVKEIKEPGDGFFDGTLIRKYKSENRSLLAKSRFKLKRRQLLGIPSVEELVPSREIDRYL